MDFSFSRLQNLFPSAKKIVTVPFWIRLALISLFFTFGLLGICLKSLDRFSQLQTLSREIRRLTSQAASLEQQKLLQQKMEKQVKAASPAYLQTLETWPLLSQEKQRVETLFKQFPQNASLKERVLFLKSGENQLHFDCQRQTPFLLHRLKHRVQMDLNDLRKFLEAVEGDRYDATQGKPFLFIRKFDLLKCDEKGDEKVYSIQVELLEKI